MTRLSLGVVVAAALLVGCGQRPGIHLTSAGAPQVTVGPSLAVPTPTATPAPEPQPTPSPVEQTAAPEPTPDSQLAPVAQPATQTPSEAESESEPPPKAPAPGDDDPTEQPAAPSDPGERLWGRSFAATRVTEGGRERPIVEGTTLRLQPFRANGESTLRYSGDCNTGGSPLRITHERFVVSNRGESSAAGCPADETAQGDWYRAFLMSDPAWQLTPNGERLTLTQGDTTIIFDQRPWPPYTDS